MEDSYISINDAKSQFPNEWLLLGNPVTENSMVVGGILLYHSQDKKEVCYLGRDKTTGYDRIKLTFTGTQKSLRKIGIMRKI